MIYPITTSTPAGQPQSYRRGFWRPRSISSLPPRRRRTGLAYPRSLHVRAGDVALLTGLQVYGAHGPVTIMLAPRLGSLAARRLDPAAVTSLGSGALMITADCPTLNRVLETLRLAVPSTPHVVDEIRLRVVCHDTGERFSGEIAVRVGDEVPGLMTAARRFAQAA